MFTSLHPNDSKIIAEITAILDKPSTPTFTIKMVKVRLKELIRGYMHSRTRMMLTCILNSRDTNFREVVRNEYEAYLDELYELAPEPDLRKLNNNQETFEQCVDNYQKSTNLPRSLVFEIITDCTK